MANTLDEEIVNVLKNASGPLKFSDLYNDYQSIQDLTEFKPDPKNRAREVKRRCNKLVLSGILIDTTGRTDGKGTGPYTITSTFTGQIPTYTPRPRATSISPKSSRVRIQPKTISRLTTKFRRKKPWGSTPSTSDYDFGKHHVQNLMEASMTTQARDERQQNWISDDALLSSLTPDEKHILAGNILANDRTVITDDNITFMLGRISKAILDGMTIETFNLTDKDIVDAIESTSSINTFIIESLNLNPVPTTEKVKQHLLPNVDLSEDHLTEESLLLVIDDRIESYTRKINIISNALRGYDDSKNLNELRDYLIFEEGSDLQRKISSLDEFSSTLTPEEKITRKELSTIIQSNLDDKGIVESIVENIFLPLSEVTNPDTKRIYHEAVKYSLNEWLNKYEEIRDREPFETIETSSKIPSEIDMTGHEEFVKRYNSSSLTKADNKTAQNLELILPQIPSLLEHLSNSDDYELVAIQEKFKKDKTLPLDVWKQVSNHLHSGTVLTLSPKSIPYYDKTKEILARIDHLDDISRNKIIEIFLAFPGYKTVPDSSRIMINQTHKKIQSKEPTPPTETEIKQKFDILKSLSSHLTDSEKRIISNIKLIHKAHKLQNAHLIVLDTQIKNHISELTGIDIDLDIGKQKYSKISVKKQLTPEEKLLHQISLKITRGTAKTIASQLKEVYQLPDNQVETLHSEMMSGEDTGANEALLTIYHPDLINVNLLSLIRRLSRK
ncbi:MAG: hypothetical protein KAS66_11870 [Candidatus Omnitrophica bacterium]|nr:hypothetical protein [Candidatus Omnitrophota bacterium]